MAPQDDEPDSVEVTEPDPSEEPQSSEAESADPPAAAKKRHPVVTFVRETVLVLVSAMVISLVLKTFFIQPFYIPSESMSPTLEIGDRIVVNKLAPGPFDIGRGDVVVFLDPGGWLSGTEVPELNPVQKALTWIGLLPENAGEHLIKRVIGLPGDNVVCCNEAGQITVNGVAIDEPYIAEGAVPSEVPFDVVVPSEHVWLLGDNRPHSADSRFNEGSVGGGFVPIANIVGRAFVIILPLDRMGSIASADETFADVPDP